MATQSAYYDWSRHEIRRDLRERYDVPKELPPELRALVTKLDESDLLFHSINWQNDRDFFP